MSKSLGNTRRARRTSSAESGAEILRLWAALVDYSEDQRIGPTILQTTIDAYRKLRNTVRYLLGALDGFERRPSAVELADMPPLERFILHRLWELDGQVRARLRGLSLPGRDRGRWPTSAPTTCRRCSSTSAATPSTATGPTSLRRRACRTVMDLVFERLTVWLAPAARLHHGGGLGDALPGRRLQRLRVIPRHAGGLAQRGRGRALGQGASASPAWSPARWRSSGARSASARRWRPRRGSISPIRPCWRPSTVSTPAEVFRTSQASLVAGEGPAGAFRLRRGRRRRGRAAAGAEGRKCARSWRILPEVGADPRYPDLSLRDADAVAWWDAARMAATARAAGHPLRLARLSAWPPSSSSLDQAVKAWVARRPRPAGSRPDRGRCRPLSS